MRESTKKLLFVISLPIFWPYWLMILVLDGVEYLIDFIFMTPPSRRRW